MDEDKGKPRQCRAYLRNMIFNYYKKEMEVQNKKFTEENTNLCNINFKLLQTLKNEEKIDSAVLNIANFYNENYVGNKDFIHIPRLKDVIENATKYPVILAAKGNEFDDENLLGVTTVKMENNKNITDNPYFPTKEENVLSITGILTKFNTLTNNGQNRIKGIGKALFKTVIRGAYYINKKEKIRLICEIDCRNKNSLKSISNAVRELQLENISVQIVIDGYYEIIGRQKRLKEAPTFVLEIVLNGNRKFDSNIIKFSYLNCEGNDLLQNIAKVIKNNSQELKRYINIKKDVIIYHKIRPINALNVEIEVGKSANGNNRIPLMEENINIYEKIEMY